MRGADGGPWRRLCALPAFWVGICYEQSALDAAWDIARKWDVDTREAWRVAASIDGFEAVVKGQKMLDLAKELVEICRVAAQYDGMYISHMRSEGNKILESVDELITIAKEAGIRSEIYHLKQSGKKNWGKLDAVIQKIDSARKAGLYITTDMYNYTAGATGLDASMPPWVQEGGLDRWIERLKKPSIKKRVIKEMQKDTDEWENLMRAAESAENLILVGFKNDSLKYLTGKTLDEVSKIRGKGPEETAIDLVIQDGSRVGTVYFLMSEENVKRQIKLPYMSFGSDAGSMASEGVFLKSSTHPRAFGNFARLLGLSLIHI